MSEPVNASPMASETPDARRVAKDRVRRALRDLRADRGLKQDEFGEQALGGASRFVVNRLEVGSSDLKLEQAEKLDDFLGYAHFVPLVEHRDRQAQVATGVDGRDVFVGRMLQISGGAHVRVVLADDLDFCQLLHRAAEYKTWVPPGRIDVVVPSRERAEQLYLNEDAADRLDNQVERQIRALFDLQASFEKDDRGFELRLYEAPGIRFSLVHVAFHGGAEVAYWPPAPEGITSADLPVAMSADPDLCVGMSRHATALMDEVNRILPNEAMVMPEKDGAKVRARFIRFVSRGEEPPPYDPREGFPVALVAPYAVTVSMEGNPVGRRMILCARTGRLDDADRYSLVSSRVEESDIRTARKMDVGAEDRPRSRRRRDPVASAIQVHEKLMEEGTDSLEEGEFLEAARREFRTHWGMEIDPKRFEPWDLPTELSAIEKAPDGKNTRPPLVPRLFLLELETAPGADESTSEFTRFMEGTHKYRPATFGREDITTMDPAKLNTFLVKALKVKDLQKLMTTELKLIAR